MNTAWRRPVDADRLQLLERFRFVRGGEEVVLPHGSQRLVALLGLVDSGLGRAKAADLLWDQPRDRASGSLRTLVWRLRGQCPGLLAADDGVLRLRRGIDVDVSRLREAATRWRGFATEPMSAGPDLRAEDLNGFRGPMSLLPGWYDDWVLLHRELLSALWIDLLTDAAEVLLVAGQPARALDLALTAVSTEPFEERLHALVARIHLAQGNGWEAVRQYRLCEVLLRTELGTEPSASFKRLLPVSPGVPRPRRADVRSPVLERRVRRR